MVSRAHSKLSEVAKRVHLAEFKETTVKGLCLLSRRLHVSEPQVYSHVHSNDPSGNVMTRRMSISSSELGNLLNVELWI